METPRAYSVETQTEKTKEFKDRLNEIINKDLSVENIDTYADDLLTELIIFTNQVLEDYTLHHPEIIGPKKELEDKAFQEYKLSNLSSILGTSQEKVEQLQGIDRFISEKVIRISEVITPPDTKEMILTVGREKYKKPTVVPRLKTLLYILQTDFNIDLNSITLTEGEVKEEMMRKLSYVSVGIPGLNRIMQVCDEAENASYIFDLSEIKQLGLDVNDINEMTKEDKNSLIENNPKVGKRLIQTQYWRDNASELLSVPFDVIASTNKEALFSDRKKIEEARLVSSSELDPWRGSWVDTETGKHWGTIPFLCRKVPGLTRDIFGVITKKENFESIKIRIGATGKVEDGFCYEDIAQHPKVRKFVEAPLVEEAGEWQGFYVDDEGKHWGPTGRLATKIGRSRLYIEGRIKDSGLTSPKLVKGINGKLIDAYAYEELIATESFKKASTASEVAATGDWSGFYTDSENHHYAPIGTIANRIMLDQGTIKRLVKEQNIDSKEVMDLTGRLMSAYLYEDVINHPLVIEHSTVPKVLPEGEWGGFYIDESGKHWGTIDRLAKKFGVAHKTIKSRVVKSKLVTKRIKDKGRMISDGFAYEDISNLL